MSNAKLKLMVSVFSRRITQGETFEEISADYPKLTAEDLEGCRYRLIGATRSLTLKQQYISNTEGKQQ